jgi:hypothetical protein
LTACRFVGPYDTFYPDKRDSEGKSLLAVPGVTVADWDEPPPLGWVPEDAPAEPPSVPETPSEPEPAPEPPASEPEAPEAAQVNPEFPGSIAPAFQMFNPTS